MKNYYDILHVAPSAMIDEIKQSTQALLNDIEADLEDNIDNPAAKKQLATKLADIQEAYSVLSNPKQRAGYDAQFETEQT